MNSDTSVLKWAAIVGIVIIGCFCLGFFVLGPNTPFGGLGKAATPAPVESPIPSSRRASHAALRPFQRNF